MSAAALAAPPFTPDDLLRERDGGAGLELVNGRLKELNMSVQSNLVSAEVMRRLFEHFAARGLRGHVFPQDSPFRCFPADPRQVRKPDVAYVAAGRLTPAQYAEDGVCTVVPDLIVEVLSPNDLAYEVDEKLEEYLAVGVGVVWVINPETRTAEVHQRAGGTVRLRGNEALSGDPVLPGFAVPLADLLTAAAPPA